MEKLELFARIRKVSSLVHSADLHEYSFNAQTISQLRQTLDELTEQYIETYC